jgi:orotidine-5'-phosphate decarboxylase
MPDSPRLKEALAKIAFPLDGDRDQALAWAKELGSAVGCLKIGLELFLSEGPGIVREIKELAPLAKIFLDLKLHDIPATVAGAVKSAAKLPVDYLTVHAQAGSEALKAASAAAGPIALLAVTVLTSLNPEEAAELKPEFKAEGRLVLHLASIALDSGIKGLVASPLEIAALRRQFGPGPFLVAPGVRPAWSNIAQDDQKRVGTPAKAIADGASLLVIGRPIREAVDRVAAARLVASEILG